MKDRFTTATCELEEKSAFACETCEPHDIDFSRKDVGQGSSRRYDVNEVLEQMRHDPSPAGP